MSGTQRGSGLLGEFGLQKDTSEAAQQGLEVAAALGSPVDPSEWRRACEVAGAQVETEVVEALAERGWIAIEEDSWSFEGDELRDALVRAASDAGRWKLHHAACAQALFELGSARPTGLARRRVEHLREAGRTYELLGPLLDAEKEAFDAGEFDACTDYLDRRDSLLDGLEVPDDDSRRAQSQWRRAQLLYALGDNDRARALAEQSIEALRETDWASERAQAALLYGRMLRDSGDFEAARASLSSASDHFAAAGDEHGLATSGASRAYIDLNRGDYSVAREGFSKALAVFEDLEDTFMVANLLIFIAQTWLFDGERDRGKQCVRRARQIAGRAGHLPNEAAAWNTLGEIAREDGDWPEARRAYRKAFEAFEAFGSRSSLIARYNLALVEIGAGRFERARDLLDELAQDYVDAGFAARSTLVYAGLMTCAAGEGDWHRWAHYFELVDTRLEQSGTAHGDIVWMAERAVCLATEHQHTTAEAQARALADAHRARLEQSDHRA